MVSDKQLAANRRNAKRSTGPKTLAGKSTASRNALRHGLSTPSKLNGPLPLRYEKLATALAAGRAPKADMARLAAELRFHLNQIENSRLFQLRMAMAAMDTSFPCPGIEELEGRALLALASEMAKLERYARRLRSRLSKVMKALDAN
jgi:hypothetical protein